MEKKVKTFWLYTIILFSVAFVIILLSAVSSSQYNAYKEESKKLYAGAQKSLIDLTNENEALRKSLSDKEKENKALSEKVAALKDEKRQITEETERYKENVKNIILARALVRDGDKAGAAEVFSEVNPEGFSEELMEIYTYVENEL
jgi:septal ring factor EnvC (AmiA/AmiB activator)